MSDLKIMPLQKPDKPLNTEFKPKSRVQLEKAAKEFESMFMTLVMKSMRDTVGESNIAGDSEKVRFFQTLLDEEYSKIGSKRSGLGLAQTIIRQLEPTLPKAEQETSTETSHKVEEPTL